MSIMVIQNGMKALMLHDSASRCQFLIARKFSPSLVVSPPSSSVLSRATPSTVKYWNALPCLCPNHRETQRKPYSCCGSMAVNVSCHNIEQPLSTKVFIMITQGKGGEGCSPPV